MFFNEIKEFTTVCHFVGKENAQKVVKKFNARWQKLLFHGIMILLIPFQTFLLLMHARRNHKSAYNKVVKLHGDISRQKGELI